MQIDSEMLALGVERELYSAISNLLVNAVRYSPAGREVTVRWYATATGMRCEVADHGIGLAPEHLARITERFYRVDLGRSRSHSRSHSRSKGGTGIGLAIVKHVLRRHGCELLIESTPGVGSIFAFDLDANHIRHRARSAGAPEAHVQHRHHLH